jgi:hypothetical protein
MHSLEPFARTGRGAAPYRLRTITAFLWLGTVLFGQTERDWMHYVRIAGHSLRSDNADQIVRSATDTGVFGIEVDNDIPGRYESFIDPTEKLKAIRAVAEKAHAAGNYAFVYIAGTECITAHADSGPHSMAKDHPDWLQRKLTGEPALFGGGTAFWIREGDEDVWITPFASEWRKRYMERVRQIAATGIDGVYVDIPYWMTHFKGWEDSWASFDDYTVAAFRTKTGLNAKKDLRLGDFRDANFRKWVDFRIAALTDFMHDIDANVKSVNPKCKTIAEIYPGIEESAVRVGSDVYELYPVVDTIAHEYETGGRSARRTPLSWFQDMIGMYSFRAFAGSKPSWMLSYSWEKDNPISPGEAMQNLAMAQLMAGTNTWDVQGHVMSGSNDIETRKVIFSWIRENENVFFHPRQPIRPVGVYFSPATRNYFAEEFIESYRGILMLLMQSHAEFQIVTPRTLSDFRGDMLILPDARCLGADEIRHLASYADSGKTLMVTGESGKYDATGAELESSPPRRFGNSVVYSPKCPGKAYYALLKKEFDREAASGGSGTAEFDRWRRVFAEGVVSKFAARPAVEITASPFVSTQIASVDGKASVFLANFKGLKSKETARQIPETGVEVKFATQKPGTVVFLPFLGRAQEIGAVFENGKISCRLPPIEKGAVVWLEERSRTQQP